MEKKELTNRIIKVCIDVHKKPGPGFLEGIYQRALEIELEKQELNFESEKEIKVFYNGQEIGRHRLDLIVENEVIVELKAVEEIHKKHYGQLRSYLKAANRKIGLIVNFADFKIDVRRVELRGEKGKEKRRNKGNGE